MIPLPLDPPGNSDLNDSVWNVVYTVNPQYQLIIVGNFPNARFFSVATYDDHSLTGQSILDTNIQPLTSSYVNPYQPGVPYAPGQQYAVPLNFGGTPGQQQTGCLTSAYNVDVNALDATQRHQGQNWNTDSGFFQQTPGAPLHEIDTPQHTNPTPTGYTIVRAYVDGSLSDPTTAPSVIVRDVASGCAYPAAYVQQSLSVININAKASASVNETQFQAHQTYNSYLPSYCYASDPQNSASWSRDRQGGSGPNPYCTYFNASVASGKPAALAAAGEVMRIRLRLPTTPPTPCTDGCSRSGTEQARYYGLSFDTPAITSNGVTLQLPSTLASVTDADFVQDANGYATLIVGTGAAIPSWITPANGYTFLDLTAATGYQNLSDLVVREILPASTFVCSGANVPYKVAVYTPEGGLMGDYAPVLDFPAASTLPQTASELVGPNQCSVFPDGLPEVAPACGVLPSNTTVISAVPPPAPATPPIGVQPSPPITLSGQGFGFLPNGLPFSGNSNSLEIADLTQGWTAGYGNSPCGVSIGTWLDSRIELVANLDQSGCPLAAGDQLAISVWNAQTGSGPVTSTLTVGPDAYYSLGSYSALVGSPAGSGTVELTAGGPWTAISNVPWLQVSNASGTGNALIQYTYNANYNTAPQSGTLTIAGLTFTVTQAGAGYNQVFPVTVLATGFNAPQGVALDGQGNVYIADTGNNAIEEWSPGAGQWNTLISSGMNRPTGVALDPYGNVYIADSRNRAIEEWNVGSQQFSSLIRGLGQPYGVAVDIYGNVYYSDALAGLVAEWGAITAQESNLSDNLTDPSGVAVDATGNVYFANTGSQAVEQWNAATQQSSVLVSSATMQPSGVAVDGQGNVYFSDTASNTVQQWNAASYQLVTVASGLSSPAGLATDPQGNVYVADENNNAIKKVTPAYLSLSTTSVSEGYQAGTDSIAAQILPAGTPFSATSDQSWLTITGVSGGIIGFAFQSNVNTSSRVAHIIVLGQTVTVTQNGNTAGNLTITAGNVQTAPVNQTFPIALQVTVTNGNGTPVQGAAVTFTVAPGATGASGTFSSTPPMPVTTDQNGNAIAPALTANNIAGQFSVTASVTGAGSVTFTLTNEFLALGASSLTVSSAAGNGQVLLLASGPWAVSSNASWLTVAPGNLSGAGNGVIQFSYAANTSPGPQTGILTVSGLTLTVTQVGAGFQTEGQLTALVSSGLRLPQGVAVDSQGNVYIADTGGNTLMEWNISTNSVSVLISSGLNAPTGVAVDSYGNVYIADTKNNAIKEWIAATGAVIPLVDSGLKAPLGIAVDNQGNVYFSDSAHNAIKEWVASSATVTTLVSSGLDSPDGVAVDAEGNVFFADRDNNAIKEWSATNNAVTALVLQGLNGPSGVAVDGEDNVYIAETGNNAIKEWSPVSQQVTVLVSTVLNAPHGVAVDASGNVYIADTNGSAIMKFAPVYVSFDPASQTVGAKSGSGSIGVQTIPANLSWTATNRGQKWLTITGTANGTVTFSFNANNSANSRTAEITVLGAQASVTQSGNPQ